MGAKAMLGIFVGGRGKRMGGRDKAALPSPRGHGSLLAQHLHLGQVLGLPCVLVGAQGGGAGPSHGLTRLADDPPGIGPLGGLCALLSHAGPRTVVALACDMPYVDRTLVEHLLAAPPAGVVAPRDPATGKWYPLFARYEPAAVRGPILAAAARGVRAFQTCFRELSVQELPLDAAQREKLRDWDRPEDLTGV